MGNHAWHQVYPFRFITMILAGSFLVILLFSLIKGDGDSPPRHDI